MAAVAALGRGRSGGQRALWFSIVGGLCHIGRCGRRLPTLLLPLQAQRSLHSAGNRGIGQI